MSSKPNVEYSRAGRYATQSFHFGTRLDSENSLAGGRPPKSAESPRTPRARKMRALTTAPRFGSHLETSSRTIPTRTVSQVRTIAIPASCQVEWVFRKIWPNVPAKIR